MRGTLVFISFLVICQLAKAQLSTEQEAWLYRIVQKTPVLKSNWQNYFEFNTDPFYRESAMHRWIDYDAIYNYQIHQPQSLTIHYDSIQASSNGLISEAAIKITLWELNEELKKHIYGIPSGNDSLIAALQKPITVLLTGGLSNKKRIKILTTLMHPSLPIFKKIEQLEATKIDAELQKQLLNKWSNIISEHSFKRSQYYFKILSGGQELINTTFLAAGEGSGTAGLLYEWEPNPADSTKRWYGKGIGLFTYKTRTSKGELRLLSHLEKQLEIKKGNATALHTSLWGLDSSFKPMLIVTDDTVSYHLFADYASKGLTPDAHLGKGISHLDRIEEHQRVNIVDALKKVKDNELINKAYESKALVEGEIKALENEIDTLRKYEPENLAAIDYRKRLIDSKLTNLSNKEKRVKELEQNFAAKFKEIDNAEQKLQSMIKLLGPAPQNWVKDGEYYMFSNGVKFDAITQDLIFPESGIDKELNIRLVSAGYTLEGHKKDEVQAYVSLTKAKERIDKVIAPDYAIIDTCFMCYYHPDEYISYEESHFSEQVLNQLKNFKHYRSTLQIAHMPDSLKSQSQRYANKPREYMHPLTIDARNRFVRIKFSSQGDTLNINAMVYADPVPTRLSCFPNDIRTQLGVKGSTADNNRYLIALRSMQKLMDIMELIDVQKTEIHNKLNVTDIEYQTLKQVIMDN